MLTDCQHCGRSFDAKRPTAKWCGSSCRGKASLARKAGVALPPTIVPLEVTETVGPVLAACTAELVEAGRVDSAKGRIVLALADRLDHARMDTGSAYAALARELRTSRDAALDGATSADDAVDELKRRREHNLSA